jgi:hypothetical protein
MSGPRSGSTWPASRNTRSFSAKPRLRGVAPEVPLFVEIRPAQRATSLENGAHPERQHFRCGGRRSRRPSRSRGVPTWFISRLCPRCTFPQDPVHGDKCPIPLTRYPSFASRYLCSLLGVAACKEMEGEYGSSEAGMIVWTAASGKVCGRPVTQGQ